MLENYELAFATSRISSGTQTQEAPFERLRDGAYYIQTEWVADPGIPTHETWQSRCHLEEAL